MRLYARGRWFCVWFFGHDFVRQSVTRGCDIDLVLSIDLVEEVEWAFGLICCEVTCVIYSLYYSSFGQKAWEVIVLLLIWLVDSLGFAPWFFPSHWRVFHVNLGVSFIIALDYFLGIVLLVFVPTYNSDPQVVVCRHGASFYADFVCLCLLDSCIGSFI